MCYSEDVSMTAFIVCTVGSAVLFTVSPSVAVFMAYVGCMQLFDFIFWRNQEENRTNYVATKAAMIVNHLQPFVLSSPLQYGSSPPEEKMVKDVLFPTRR